MTHEDYKEMIALAALDALDDDDRGNERRALDAHLAGCAECRAELEALRDAAASLVYAAAPPLEAPAPELRARILTAIKSQPQDARRSPANGDAVTASQTSNVSSSSEFEKRREAREVRVSRRLLVFGSLAASLAVAALLVTLALAWQRNARLQSELARLSETVNQTQQELARTRSERELLAAPEAHTATLSGTKVAERARARLTFDAQTGRAMLMAADLPPAPPGKAYQLWFIAEGKPPMPGSVFQPDARGHAEMHETIPPEGRNAAVFAVTLEPAGGVSAPTGEMYLKSSAS
ncbi:MAG TPA: anti-sigma factor [Pyrinomonadaceae bacterium]|jgi:cell division protein FtsB|nr:anti-sigma factor [Pyrinomonadaceae bacterium]